MKKFLTVLLIAVITVTGLYAAKPSTTDIDLTLNAAANNFNFDLTDSQGTDANFKFSMLLDGQVNVHFKGEHGFFTGVSFETEKTVMGLRGGYSYKTYLGNNFDLVIDAGLGMSFGFKKTSPFTLGTALDIDFNYNVMKNMYLQFGVRWDFDFLMVINGKVVDGSPLESKLVLPTFGFGWAF